MIRLWTHQLRLIPLIHEIVPSYRAILVTYDPLETDYETLKQTIAAIQPDATSQQSRHRIIDIPTCYGGQTGPDLDFVAQFHGLSPAEVIKRHSQVDYLVYMLGFTPGFAYLGGLDEQLQTPRLSSPRLVIPAGSVGIADHQTGIYPMASPGGWQLIGQTPVQLFNPSAPEPFLLQAGDWIRFLPIESDTFHEIERLIERGDYRPAIRYQEADYGRD